jgi:parallel beta-helix repeat protein
MTVRTKFLTWSVSTTVLGLTAWAIPVAADASPAGTVVTCGQTLTSTTRLANDLVNCAGNGLVIGADNITVDLAGHSISGLSAAGSEGIADDGHGGVHIQNGTITNFFLNGVGLRGAPQSSVCNLTIRKIGAGGVEGDASAGVLVKDSPRTTVLSNTVVNDVSAFQSDGVDVLFSGRTLVSDNRLVNSAWDGMFVYQSPGTRVLGNTLDGNQNHGIEVNFGSDGITLEGNHAGGNGASGLVVGALTDARIASNTLTGNRDTGLFMFDLIGSKITENRAAGNGVGIHIDGGQNGSHGNRIVDNNTSRNLYFGLLLTNGASNNSVFENVSNANGSGSGDGAGIVLFAVTGNNVRGNVANRNANVGIGVFEGQPGDAAGNALADNTANSNGAHGIVAVAGTVDSGSNKAQGNTPLPNCLGVVCA